MQIELQGISKTLLMPLWGRAQISKEKNDFFEDLKAIELVDNLNFDFSQINATIPDEGNISTVIRAKIVDDKIKEFLATHPTATIINLGAGLETTYYRINNDLLKWYDVDLPEVIDLKKSLLSETPNLSYIAGSIFDFNWMNSLSNSSSDGILFISAGVLEYFDKKIVLKFLSDLATSFPGGEIIFNTSTNNKLSSYFTKRTMKKMGITASPAICGNNFIKDISKTSNKIEIVERVKLFSKVELKKFWNESTVKKLHYYELFSPSFIVHLKFKENLNFKS